MGAVDIAWLPDGWEVLPAVRVGNAWAIPAAA